MGREDVENIIFQSMNRPRAFKNMLQLLSVSNLDGGFLGNSAVKKDLSGIKFRNMHFRDVSFAGCNLDTTEFHACDLRGTEFSGAIISNTGFFNMSPDLMVGANFGDMNTVHSIRVDGRAGARNLGDSKAAMRWLGEQVNVAPDPSVDALPCPAAEQLRHLFGKYIRPDGTAKRKWVGSDAINRGSRYIQRPENVSDAAIRAGYLTPEGRFHRLHRADGTKYPEMVEFVRRLEASPDIRFLLDEICGETSCAHIVG